jgi:hypothetical protein
VNDGWVDYKSTGGDLRADGTIQYTDCDGASMTAFAKTQNGALEWVIFTLYKLYLHFFKKEKNFFKKFHCVTALKRKDTVYLEECQAME